MTNHVDHGNGDVSDGDKSSVQILPPPSPEPPIEISDSEGSYEGFSEFEYTSDTFSGDWMEIIGTVSTEFQVSAVGGAMIVRDKKGKKVKRG